MRVFVSHHHSDKKFASVLREELVAQGLDVWDPESALGPGSNWLKETGRALERADAIVFVLSRRALQSPFVLREIDYALTTKRLANRVYPVIVGTDVKVPWILAEIGVIHSMGIGSAKRTATRIAKAIQKPTKSAYLKFLGTRTIHQAGVLERLGLLKRARLATKSSVPKAKSQDVLKG